MFISIDFLRADVTNALGTHVVQLVAVSVRLASNLGYHLLAKGDFVSGGKQFIMQNLLIL